MKNETLFSLIQRDKRKIGPCGDEMGMRMESGWRVPYRDQPPPCAAVGVANEKLPALILNGSRACELKKTKKTKTKTENFAFSHDQVSSITSSFGTPTMRRRSHPSTLHPCAELQSDLSANATTRDGRMVTEGGGASGVCALPCDEARATLTIAKVPRFTESAPGPYKYINQNIKLRYHEGVN